MGGERIRAGEEVEPASRPVVIPTRRLEAAELDQLRAGLEQVRAVIGELQEYARTLPPQLGPVDVALELRRTSEALARMGVTALPVLGARYEEEVALIQGLLEQAEGLAGENAAGATLLLEQARRKMEGFQEVIGVEMRMLEEGRPPGVDDAKFRNVLDSVEAALIDFGTEKEARANATLRAARLYADNASFYNMDARAVRAERDFLFGFIIEMGEAAQRGDAYDAFAASEDERKLAGYENKLEELRAQMTDVNVQALTLLNEDLGTMRAALQGREEARRIDDRLRAMQEEAAALLAGLRDPAESRGVSQHAIDDLLGRYRLLTTGERPQTEEEREADLAANAANLRGAGAESDRRASQEGTAEWFGAQALGRLGQGSREAAELAVAMGQLQRSAQQAQESASAYFTEETYLEILEVVAGRVALPPLATDRIAYLAGLGTLVKVAALAHDIETLTAKYEEARPREQAVEAERRQRILDALTEARRRLVMEADLDGATRLFNMAGSYAEVLESVEGAWRSGWVRSDDMEAAIDAELEGTDAGALFDSAFVVYTFMADSRAMRDGLAGWGRGVATQKNVVERVLTAAEGLAEAGLLSDAYEMLTLTGMYVDSVTRLGEMRGGKLQAVDYDFSGMEEALLALAGGEAVDEEAMRGRVVEGFNASQATAVNREAAALVALARERPLDRQQIERVLRTARENAEEGDIRSAWTLIGYVRDYYGIADAEQNLSEGWRYAIVSGPDAGAEGYAQGRRLMIRAMEREMEATGEEDHSAAERLFGRGAQQIADTEQLLAALARLLDESGTTAAWQTEEAAVPARTTYMFAPGPEGPRYDERQAVETFFGMPEGAVRRHREGGEPIPLAVLRGYEEEHPNDPALLGGPTLTELLERVQTAARTGNIEAYNEAGQQFIDRRRIVGERLIRFRNFENMMAQLEVISQSLQQLEEGCRGARGAAGIAEQSGVEQRIALRRQDLERLARDTAVGYYSTIGELPPATDPLYGDISAVVQGRSPEPEIPALRYAAFLGDFELLSRDAVAMASALTYVQGEIEKTEQYIEVLAAQVPRGELVRATPGMVVEELRTSLAALQLARRDLLAGSNSRPVMRNGELVYGRSGAESQFMIAMDHRAIALEMQSLFTESDYRAMREAAQPVDLRVDYIETSSRLFSSLVSGGFGEGTAASRRLNDDARALSIVDSAIFSVPTDSASQELFADHRGSQREIVQLALNGYLNDASSRLSDMQSTIRTIGIATNAALFVAGVGSLFIPEVGPYICTGIFGSMAVHEVIYEATHGTGEVSTMAWVNLGFILGTAALGEVVRVLEWAAVEATVGGRASVAISRLRYAKYIEWGNIGAGVGMSLWMGKEAMDMFRAGMTAEGVLTMAMAAFPVVHTGGRYMVARRTRARARARGVELPAPVLDEVGAALDATLARARAAARTGRDMVRELLDAGATPQEAFALAVAGEARIAARPVRVEEPARRGTAYRTGEGPGGERPTETRAPETQRPATAPRPGETAPQQAPPPQVTVQVPRRGGRVEPTPEGGYRVVPERRFRTVRELPQRYRDWTARNEERAFRARNLDPSRMPEYTTSARDSLEATLRGVARSREQESTEAFQVVAAERATGDAARLAEAEQFAASAETAAAHVRELVGIAYRRANQLSGREGEAYWSFLRRIYARADVRARLEEMARTDPELGRMLRVIRDSVERAAGSRAETDAYLAGLAREPIPEQEIASMTDVIESQAAATRQSAQRQMEATIERQQDVGGRAGETAARVRDLEVSIEAREAEAARLEAALQGDATATEARVTGLRAELERVRGMEADARRSLDRLREETGLSEERFANLVERYERAAARAEEATTPEAAAAAEAEMRSVVEEVSNSGAGISESRWDNLASDSTVQSDMLRAHQRRAVQLEAELAAAETELGAITGARGADRRLLTDLQRSNERQLRRLRGELAEAEQAYRSLQDEYNALGRQADELWRTAEENAPMEQTSRLFGMDTRPLDRANVMGTMADAGRVPRARVITEREGNIGNARRILGELTPQDDLQRAVTAGLDRRLQGAVEGDFETNLLAVLRSNEMVDAVRASGRDVEAYMRAVDGGSLQEVLSRLGMPVQIGEGISQRSVNLQMRELMAFIEGMRGNASLVENFAAAEVLRTRATQEMSTIGETAGRLADDTTPFWPAARRWIGAKASWLLRHEPFWHWGGAQAYRAASEAIPGGRASALWRSKWSIVVQAGTYAAIGYIGYHYFLGPYLDELANAPDIRAGRAAAQRDFPNAPVISEENALFLRSELGGRFYRHIPTLLPQGVEMEPTSDADRRALLERREIVVNPERINELLDDGRRMANRLEDVNRLLATIRRGENPEAVQRAMSDLRSLLGDMDISLEAALALGKETLEIEDMFDLRIDNWLARGVVDRFAEFGVEFDCTSVGMTDTEIAVAVPFLAEHIDAYLFLWGALSDGFIPAAYMDDAVALLARGNAYSSLMEQAQREGKTIQQVMQEELVDAGYYLSAPIATDSFLAVLDDRAAANPAFEPVVERVLERYRNNPEAMARLNAFTIGQQEDIYGNVEQFAAQIVREPDAAALLAQARDPAGTTTWFVGYGQLGVIDPRLLERADLVRFVAQHSSRDERSGVMTTGQGLLKWITDNATGDNPHLFKPDGTTSLFEVLELLAADRNAASASVQSIAAYADRQAGTFAGRRLWSGPTPAEEAAVRLPPRVQGRPAGERAPAAPTTRPRRTRAEAPPVAATEEAALEDEGWGQGWGMETPLTSLVPQEFKDFMATRFGEEGVYRTAGAISALVGEGARFATWEEVLDEVLGQVDAWCAQAIAAGNDAQTRRLRDSARRNLASLGITVTPEGAFTFAAPRGREARAANAEMQRLIAEEILGVSRPSPRRGEG